MKLLKLPEEKRPIGHWGRLHQAYLKQAQPLRFNDLLFTCKLPTYLADLNERAAERYNLIIEQIKEVECVDEALKMADQMEWVRRMNNIRN